MSACRLGVAPTLNLARLDLASLKLVVHCADMGSISAAAPACHLSLMGASERLRRLEDAFGKPLFLRHRRGLEPTDAGRAVVLAGQQILLRIEQLSTEVHLLKTSNVVANQNCGRRGKTSE